MSVDNSNRPKRKQTPPISEGKALVALQSCADKIRRLAKKGDLLKSERYCFEVAVAIVDQTIAELQA